MCAKLAVGLFILSAIVMIAVIAVDIQGKKGIPVGSGKNLDKWTAASVAFFLSFSSFWLLKYHKMHEAKV